MAEIEQLAYAGLEMPNNLLLQDKVLFLALKNIYGMYKNGIITKAEAMKEKKQIVRDYETLKSEIEFISREALNLSKRISDASENYKNNRTIENADKLYKAFYNIKEE